MANANAMCNVTPVDISFREEMQKTTFKLPMSSYAYGFFDIRCKASASNASIQSAYEVNEDQYVSDVDTEYFSVCNSIPPPEEFRSLTSLETLASHRQENVPTENHSKCLPDLLNSVQKCNISIENISKSIDENIHRKPTFKFAPRSQSTPLKPPRQKCIAKSAGICYPKPLVDQKIVQTPVNSGISSDDRKIAQVIHDIVFDRYEDSYKRLKQKLRKLQLSVEEKRFRSVIEELESTFENSQKGKNNAEAVEKSALDEIHSSSDSECESDNVGIPHSSSMSKNENGTTGQSPTDAKDDISKPFLNVVHLYIKDVSESVPVNAQVYACNMEINGGNTHDIHAENERQEASSSARIAEFLIEAQQNINVQRSQSQESKNSEYNELKFIQNAIGEELLRSQSSELFQYRQTASIDTDDVSALLSSRSTLAALIKRRRKPKRSLISNSTNSSYEESPYIYDSTELVQDSGNLSTPDLVNEPFRYSYTSYEDVTNLGLEIYSDDGKKQIKKHIYINEKIIEQTEKMLNFGVRKTSHFVGSHAHLEGERILIISKMRKQVLINYLNRIPEPTSEASARVTIENLRCTLNTLDSKHIGQQYFVCVLQHKTTVYSTRIAAPNKLGWIDFGGFYIFEDVSNTFSIKIQLYSVNIPTRTQQMCIAMPFLKASSKLPLMELAGEIYIGMLNIKNKKFTFKNSQNIKNKEHKLTVSIEASLHWPETLSGFVNVGTGKIDHQPFWNRRWCVLEDAKIKYYNCPSDADFGPPIDVIDLQFCKSCDEADINKYLNRKTLRLFLDDSKNFKRILLSPDSADEYKQWSRHIEIVLKLIKEWHILKK